MSTICRGPVAASAWLLSDPMDYANNAAASSWTFSGSNALMGQTGGPGVLSGVPALRVLGGSTTARPPTFGPVSGTTYIYLKRFAITAAPSGEAIYLNLRDGAGVGFLQIRVRTTATNGLRIQDTVGGGITSAGTYVIDTVYSAKVAYTPGTPGGNNGVCTLWLSTDGVSWTLKGNRTTSDASADLRQVRFEGTTDTITFTKGLYVTTSNLLPNEIP